MATQEQVVGWDEALTNDYVKFVNDEPTIIEFTNWKLVKAVKFGKEQVEFKADVLKENGVACEKQFTTVSTRFKSKLRDILATKQPTEIVKIQVIATGDNFDKRYSVKVLQ